MENQRFLLYFTLFFISYLLWAEWQIAYGPQPVEETAVISKQEVLPEIAEESGAIPDTVADETVTQTRYEVVTSGQRIHVLTDILDIEIDTKGGDIRKATLLNYSIEAKEPEVKFILMNDQEDLFHIAQSGIVSKEKQSAPTHNAIYSTSQTNYRLEEGESKIVVPLVWRGADGVEVIKTYTFYQGKYNVDVNVKINAGNKDWRGSQYLQLVRTQPSGDGESAFIHTYTGGVV